MKVDRKINRDSGIPASQMSPAKKRVFWIVTVSSPLLILILLEVVLRIFNYGGDLGLFIPGPPGYENYLRLNPNVARRYFSSQSITPSPPKQLFLKQKPKNGYRMFVLGESSAAGFPYETNASFPNVLERALSNAFPEKRIEVINVSMSAISSYTLLDLIPEILRQSPDALLIYTGHNEYYGALGVGSEQSIGNSRWMIRGYLHLCSIKTFLMLRDFFDWLKTRAAQMSQGGSAHEPNATLMESMVAQQTIPYGSELYEEGKEQFEENIEAVLQKASEKRVTVVLGELVSNLRDQSPFISVEDKEGKSAQSYFASARKEEAEGDYDKARQDYFKAKDLDALRFRAPEGFNDIVHSIAKKHSCPVVPTVAYFEAASPHGIIGNSLILEHLHPNIDGYFLLAKAFYQTMEERGMISSQWPGDSCIENEKGHGITELDSVYGAINVQHLKSSWPFQPKTMPNHFVENFHPRNPVEEIAFRVMQSSDFSLEAGHMELGKFYEEQGNLKKAFDEYDALITSIPQEMEFYEKAATVLLEEKEYEQAAGLLRKSLEYKENPFALKWLGQIALMGNDYKDAIAYLTKADPLDAQVIFNLGRAYYLDGKVDKGDECLVQLQGLSPKPEYLTYLRQLRVMVHSK